MLIRKIYDLEFDKILIFDMEILNMINEYFLFKGNVFESICKLDEERNYYII